ncbi:MAG TPA: Ku protein [Acidimicrobiales bacterium]|nr:Ku protein [Acidimicrobiales bacterium]
MPRAIWTGAVSFGLVNIPVKVYSAVRDHQVRFHQVDKETGSRIRYEKVAEKTGDEVDSDQIVLGYEVEKGTLVTLDPGELEELRPRTTRSIDISDFVELAAIDPVYYQRTYWLVPDGDGATRAYRLLASAMVERERVGIGTVVMRNKQYLAAIRPRDGALALSTMRFADEIVDGKEIDGLPGRGGKIAANEMKLATQIIDSLAGPWQPEGYKDTYTEEVRRLVKAHADGDDVVVEDTPAEGGDMLDLMAALEASLKGPGPTKPAKTATGKNAPAKKTPAKKTPAKKATAKKATAKKATARKAPAGRSAAHRKSA